MKIIYLRLLQLDENVLRLEESFCLALGHTPYRIHGSRLYKLPHRYQTTYFRPYLEYKLHPVVQRRFRQETPSSVYEELGDQSDCPYIHLAPKNCCNRLDSILSPCMQQSFDFASHVQSNSHALLCRGVTKSAHPSS